MLSSKSDSVEMTKAIVRALVAFLCLLVVPAQASVIQDLSFTSRSGGKFEIRVDFDEVPEGYKGYTVEKPARIALDFPGTQSALDRRRFSLPYGNATAVMLVEAGERTRMVVNLVKLVPYETRVQGNSLFVIVGEGGESDYVRPGSDPNALISKVERVLDVEAMIDDLQFQRTPDGEGRLILTLTEPDVDVNVFSEAGDIKVQF
jgi:type IV pilus assembly protein PilQ